MNRIWLGVIASLLVSSYFALQPASVHAQSASTEGDKASVQKVLDDFVDSFNRHDAHGWAMPFLEDGEFTNVTGLTRHGRAEVEERFKGLFAGSLKNSHRVFTMRHIRFVKPDVVFADADWALTGSLAQDGSVNPVRKGIFTWVMVKTDGQWKFADFTESEFVTIR